MATTTSKTVLITGATRGIGLAFVERYVQDGWRVIATARNVATAEQLKALSPLKIVQLETDSEESIARAAEALRGEPIDLLINNAGILEDGSLETTTKESLMKQFEVNAVGPFLVTRVLLPNLKLAVKNSGEAVVASISSQLGSITRNTGGRYGYRASKAGLNMINTSLAIDLKGDGITAIVLHPGYVATDMNSHKGVVQPVDAVAGMTATIAKLKPEDTGKFFDYTGAEMPW